MTVTSDLFIFLMDIFHDDLYHFERVYLWIYGIDFDEAETLSKVICTLTWVYTWKSSLLSALFPYVTSV